MQEKCRIWCYSEWFSDMTPNQRGLCLVASSEGARWGLWAWLRPKFELRQPDADTRIVRTGGSVRQIRVGINAEGWKGGGGMQSWRKWWRVAEGIPDCRSQKFFRATPETEKFLRLVRLLHYESLYFIVGHIF